MHVKNFFNGLLSDMIYMMSRKITPRHSQNGWRCRYQVRNRLQYWA